MSYLEMALKASKARQAANEQDSCPEPTKPAEPTTPEPLGDRPATCSTDCYQVGPGKWIHRPWAGCTTIKAEAPPQRKVAVVCRHCGGEKRCNCIACYETGECVTCKGTGQVWRWVQ